VLSRSRARNSPYRKPKGLAVGCAPDTFLGGAHQLAESFLDDGGIGRVTRVPYVMTRAWSRGTRTPTFLPAGAGPILISDPITLPT